jgi:hypothetical protein
LASPGIWLEDHDAAYVLSTKVNDTLITVEGTERRADELIAELPARAWRRLSVGAGAQATRVRLGSDTDSYRLAGWAWALAAGSPLGH